MGRGHYEEYLEGSLNDMTRKLALAIEELKRCHTDLFEAEDKFHILSFYIKDDQAHDCATTRRDWMNRSGLRVEQTLKQIT